MKYNATAIQQHQAARLLNHNFNVTKKNILGDGLKLCRRAKAFNSTITNAQIAIKQNTNGQITADLHDVAHCGNAHLCAYCSATKAAHLRKWIKKVLVPAVNTHRGLVLGLLTLTAAHRRNCDWSAFVRNFNLALEAFGKTMLREYAAIGCIGRVRAAESPVGGNGLHYHIHDLFTYLSNADLIALKAIMIIKWKAALKKYGLRCGNQHGVDIKPHGKFDPCYIAQEIAAHDTKTNSKSDLVTLFKLLDKSARGDEQAGKDWLRAAIAIQGRDRWNVGQLAKKLGIPSPSKWLAFEGDGLKPEPANIIEYPQSQHMMATEPNSTRNGLAMILRTARQSLSNTVATQNIVVALCKDYTKQRLLAAPLAIAAAYARSTAHTVQLVAGEAITPVLAIELNARSLTEIQLQQKERDTALVKKLNAITSTAPILKPNDELEFL